MPEKREERREQGRGMSHPGGSQRQLSKSCETGLGHILAQSPFTSACREFKELISSQNQEMSSASFLFSICCPSSSTCSIPHPHAASLIHWELLTVHPTTTARSRSNVLLIYSYFFKNQICYNVRATSSLFPNYLRPCVYMCICMILYPYKTWIYLHGWSCYLYYISRIYTSFISLYSESLTLLSLISSYHIVYFPVDDYQHYQYTKLTNN